MRMQGTARGFTARYCFTCYAVQASSSRRCRRIYQPSL